MGTPELQLSFAICCTVNSAWLPTPLGLWRLAASGHMLRSSCIDWARYREFQFSHPTLQHTPFWLSMSATPAPRAASQDSIDWLIEFSDRVVCRKSTSLIVKTCSLV